MLDFLIGNDFLSSLIAFGIVLIPAVIIHELGHFLAAKAIGITVLEFGIGFPPRVFKLFTWGETEFTLNWIPLGGFVRPLGEDMVRPLTEEETQREREQLIAQHEKNLATNDESYKSEREELADRGIYEVMSVNEAKPYPRIFFMAAGALANFLSAILIFIAIGLIGVPEIVGDRIAILQLSPSSELAQIGIQPDDFIERINGNLFQDSDDFIVQLRELVGTEVVFTVLRPPLAEDGDDIIFESEGFIVTESFLSDFEGTGSYVRVSSISENSPAHGVLEPNDVIVGVDGESLLNFNDDSIRALQDISVDRAGEEITLNVFRNSEEIETILTPRENPPEGQGRIGIGITLGYVANGGSVYVDDRAIGGIAQIDFISQDLPNSISYSFERVGDIFSLMGEFPARLIRGATEPEERRLVSIVGVSQIGGRFLQDSVEDDRPTLILEYIALISIALGVTNLLPIPALDGGRILFVIVEIIRGRPISPERESIVHLAGLIFLLFIGVIFIVNDLFNPITNSLP